MHGCDELATCSADPHPNEVIRKVVEFLSSEVRFIPCKMFQILCSICGLYPRDLFTLSRSGKKNPKKKIFCGLAGSVTVP